MISATANSPISGPADTIGGDEIDATIERLERERRQALRSIALAVPAVLAQLLVTAAPVIALARVSLDGEIVDSYGHREMPEWIRPWVGWIIGALLVWVVTGLALMARTALRMAVTPYRAWLGACKQTLLTAVCRQHFPTLAYEPRHGIAYRVFDASKLFERDCDIYSSDDRFSGRIGHTEVCFAEAIAKHVRRRWFAGEHQSNEIEETYFRGIVFIADFHKHFHSATRIAPRTAKLPPIRHETPAIFENPEFESVFQVRTTDQVDIRYLLSTRMLERFVELNRSFPGLRARFADERLMLMLPSPRDRFEPSVLVSVRSRHAIEAFVRDVREILSVVDELQLNTRIWSKT